MPTLDWIGKKAVVNHHRDVSGVCINKEKSNGTGLLKGTMNSLFLKDQAAKTHRGELLPVSRTLS